MFKLVIQDDEGKTTVVPLIRDEITIGRKEGNTIRLTERNVSRRHARILRNNGEVHIEDLGSYNGIRVNNARIAERVSLRVSDQVQIGDYKLYLKAEGVEQVDDARTMPIERVGMEAGSVTATDVMPATAAPTAPIAIPVPQQIPATPSPVLPGAPRMVGDPNRTLVAVADTDPHGRPVASQAVVSALTAPVGYGKLVVLSSNFAGKEFELSRSQMIVGRTDENDIVINHRSISRNHAKLVRETDTGRYTISDLQSSNGVRVNGQDYGKVELRRGDVIDLGHVRLRFVEPGEDFVFSRDAVITDVPEAAGRRGLLVAIVLGLLVLAAVTVYFVTRGPDEGGGKGSGSNPIVGDNPDGPEKIAMAEAAVENPPPIDATPTIATNDAEKERIKECSLAQTNQKWVDLETCGQALSSTNATRGKEFIQKAKMEAKAEVANRDLGDFVRAKETKKARAQLKNIPEDSVYHADATKAFKKYEDGLIDSSGADLGGYVTRKDCNGYNTRAKQINEQHGARVLDEAKQKAGRCEAAKPTCTDATCPNGTHCDEGNGKCVKNPVVAKTCVDTGCPAGETCEKDGKCKKAVIVTPPPNKCSEQNLADLEAKATTNENSGNAAAALVNLEALMACGKGNFISRAYLQACHAKQFCKARAYFLRIGNPNLAQVCLKETPPFDVRDADAAKKLGCQ